MVSMSCSYFTLSLVRAPVGEPERSVHLLFGRPIHSHSSGRCGAGVRRRKFCRHNGTPSHFYAIWLICRSRCTSHNAPNHALQTTPGWRSGLVVRFPRSWFWFSPERLSLVVSCTLVADGFGYHYYAPAVFVRGRFVSHSFLAEFLRVVMQPADATPDLPQSGLVLHLCPLMPCDVSIWRLASHFDGRRAANQSSERTRGALVSCR